MRKYCFPFTCFGFSISFLLTAIGLLIWVGVQWPQEKECELISIQGNLTQTNGTLISDVYDLEGNWISTYIEDIFEELWETIENYQDPDQNELTRSETYLNLSEIPQIGDLIKCWNLHSEYVLEYPKSEYGKSKGLIYGFVLGGIMLPVIFGYIGCVSFHEEKEKELNKEKRANNLSQLDLSYDSNNSSES